MEGAPTGAPSRLAAMAGFRAAYLIHGDDHGRIGERRARLRAMDEAAAGSAGVEVYEGDACTPEAIAAALATMTFAMGRRFVIADGVERWKEGDVAAVAAALQGADPETLTAAFFAREEGRYKAPAKLHEVVQAVGGQVAEEATLKARELPRWLGERAQELGVTLDTQGAKALLAQVGDRRQRLLRELEKLALEYGEGAQLGVQEVQEACASSAERKVWTLADALVAGDRRTATRLLLELRQQGERLPSLIYNMTRRLRDALAIAEALQAGQSPAQVRKTLRMPSFAADRLISDVSKRDVEGLRRALAAMADLEVDSRGGSGGALNEEALALQAVLIAAG
jgi:DNA polymerase III subunit delta